MKSYKFNELSKGEQEVVKNLINGYVMVFGADKWLSFTEDEKGKVVATLARIALGDAKLDATIRAALN